MRIFNVADLGELHPKECWVAFQAISNVWKTQSLETYKLVIELQGRDDSSNVALSYSTKEDRDTALAKLLDWWGQA